MAYATGSAADLEDFLSDLDTFLTGNGWTQDQFDTGVNQAAWSKNFIFVSMAWATTVSTGEMSIHQATGYTGGNRPGKHPNDSGNGFNTSASPTEANILTERCVNSIGNGPFASYHFFEQNSGPAYVHVVVQSSTGVYRHFGFGELIKTGDWAGGEYCYGMHYASGTVGPIQSVDTILLDGHYNNTSGESERRAATIKISGMPGQAGASKWGQIWGNINTIAEPTDDNGDAKIQVQGGFRAGPVARCFPWPAGTTSGLISAYPIALFYNDVTNNFAYFLGYMPDVRGVNIKFMAPEQEVTIGSDTWVCFPMSQKTTVSGVNRSYNSGIMYKKVTA